MSLFGLYYRGATQIRGRLAWIQVGAGALGFPLMTGGLAVYLSSGSHAAEPFIAAGSLLTFASMALFLVVLLKDAAARAEELSDG